MASVYVHLSGKNVDDAILKLHGLSNKEKDNGLQTTLVKCLNCGEINSENQTFCIKCTYPIRLDKRNEDLEFLLLDFLKIIAEENPRIKEKFAETVKRKNMEMLFK